MTRPIFCHAPRSLRIKSTTMTFSARSFSLVCSSSRLDLSCCGSALRKRVPLMGLAVTSRPRTFKNCSGDTLAMAKPCLEGTRHRVLDWPASRLDTRQKYCLQRSLPTGVTSWPAKYRQRVQNLRWYALVANIQGWSPRKQILAIVC